MEELGGGSSMCKTVYMGYYCDCCSWVFAADVAVSLDVAFALRWHKLMKKSEVQCKTASGYEA